MEFVCKYAKASGEVVRVVQVGQNAEEVKHRLQEQGFLPISVKARGVSLSGGFRKRQTAVNAQDFIVFNQQFVALIKAGLPILRSLDLIKSQVKNPILKRYVEDIRDRVHSGALLSEALRAQGVFPVVYTASIYAGERSGNLVDVINRFIQYVKTILTVRKRFLSSFIYTFFYLSGIIICIVNSYCTVNHNLRRTEIR